MLGCVIVHFPQTLLPPLPPNSSIRDYNAIEKCLEASAKEWAEPEGWKVTWVIASGKIGQYTGKVIVTGPPPFPNRTDFPEEDAAVCGVDIVEILFVPLSSIEL